MPLRIILGLSILFLAGATPPATTQPITTQRSDSLQQLIAQLDAPEFGVRELAEEKLSAMGSAIAPRLQQALHSNLSDEAKARLNDVLSRLEEAMALHATVTMHYANAPVQKILEDFAAQSGGDLGISDPSVQTFTRGRIASVDLDNAGFWQALRVVSDASRLTPWIGQSGLTLTPEMGRPVMQIDFASPYAQSSGGFFIIPRVCQELRAVNYDGNQHTGSMTLNLDVVPEPKLHVLSAMGMDWMKECVDDKGNSLIAPGFNRRIISPRFFNMRGPRQLFWPLYANLRDIPGMGTKIARLRGELTVVVRTRSQVFEIDDITHARGVVKSDGEMDVTVAGCSKMNLNYRIDLSCSGIGINPGDSSVQDLISSIRLMDDQGKIIPSQSVNFQPSINNGVGRPQTVNLMVIFQPSQNTPARLQWEKTLEQKKLSVPFELHDLPLP